MAVKVRRIKSPNYNFLQIRFSTTDVILQTEWFASNGCIDLGLDRKPVSIEIYDYEKNPKWTITQDVIDRYSLSPWADDLKSVKDVWFKKGKKTLLGSDLRTTYSEFLQE